MCVQPLILRLFSTSLKSFYGILKNQKSEAVVGFEYVFILF